MVSTPGRILLTTLVTALVVMLGFAGVSQTLAMWNSQVAVSGSAGAANLAVTTDFGGANADFFNHQTSVTGSFSLKNTTVTTSTRPANFTATISAGALGAASLKSALTVTIWPRTGSSCTPSQTPSGVVAQGTWTDSPFTVTGTLVAGAEAHYCMRTEAAERTNLSASTGAMSINPVISATLSIGNWISNVATANAVQKTLYIYENQNPQSSVWYQVKDAANGRCAVSPGSHNSSISRANSCNNTANNQQWKFEPTGDGYQRIIPRNNANIRLDTASENIGAAVRTRTVDSSRISQQWQMQFKGNNTAGDATYQMVNRVTGYCMQAAGNSYTQQLCDDGSAQAFTLVVRGVDVSLNVTCTSTGGTVTYQWSGQAVGPYVFQFQSGTSGSYAAASPAVTAGTTSMTFTPAQIGSLLNQGANNMKVSWLGYDISAAVGSVWKNGSGTSATLGCKAPTLEVVTCLQAPPNSIAISWGHDVPSGSTYTLQLIDGTGGTGATLATVSSGSGTTLTADNWADGLRTIRVTSSTGPVVDLQVAKTGGTGNNAVERLWCVNTQVAAVCSPQAPANRAGSVTLSWLQASAVGSNVMMTLPGEDAEVFYTVQTNQGMSQISVPARDLWNYPSAKFTLYGGATGFDMGEKSFDNSRYWWSGWNYESRCS